MAWNRLSAFIWAISEDALSPTESLTHWAAGGCGAINVDNRRGHAQTIAIIAHHKAEQK